MASLSSVSDSVKKFVAIFIIVIIVSLLLKLASVIFGGIEGAINSSAPLNAQNGFGTLPPFQVNSVIPLNKGSIDYQIQTPSGSLPKSQGNVVTVYGFKSTNLSLLSSTQATHIAQYFNFTSAPTSTNNDIYIWQQNNQKMIYDIKTAQYRLSSINAYSQINSDNSNGKNILTNDGITSAAGSIMQTLPNQISSDYSLASPDLVYLNYASNGSVTEVSDISLSNAVKVIYKRKYNILVVDGKNVNDLMASLIGDNPRDGNINMILDSDTATPQSNLIEFNFSNSIIDPSKTSTYNLKTPTQAWQDVKIGQAYLVSLVKDGQSPYLPYKQLSVSKFQLQDMYLAYYDGLSKQDYMQPIYVMSGEAVLTDNTNAKFFFYTSAISN